MKQTKLKRLLASLLSISMVGSFAGTGISVSADAGEAPPSVTPDEMVFPDPDSFSYDDVEVNFAKALQYVLYFYDANKCGYDVDENGEPGLKWLEWRGDCHTEDYNIHLKPMSKEGADAKFGTNLSQDFIDEYKDILDPDGDGLRFEWWFQVFPDETALPEIAGADSPKAVIEIPGDAAGRQLHLVCEVHDDGPFNLVSYRRIIITVD